MIRSTYKTRLFVLILLLQSYAALPVNAQARRWSREEAKQQYRKGNVFFKMGDMKSAMRAYMQSIQHYPPFWPSYLGMADTYQAQDRHLDGIQILRTFYKKKWSPQLPGIEQIKIFQNEIIPNRISLLQSLYAHRVKLTEDAILTFCGQSRVSSESIFDYLDAQKMQLSEQSCRRVAKFAAAALRSSDSEEHLRLGRQYDFSEEDVSKFAAMFEKCGPILTFRISKVQQDHFAGEKSIAIEGTVHSTKGLLELRIGDRVWPITPGEELVHFEARFPYDASKILLVAEDLHGNRRQRSINTQSLEQRLDRWIKEALGQTLQSTSTSADGVSLYIWGIVEQKYQAQINLHGDYQFSEFAQLFADLLKGRLLQNPNLRSEQKVVLETNSKDIDYIVYGTYELGNIVSVRLCVTDSRSGNDIFAGPIEVEYHDFDIGTDFRTSYKISAEKR